METSALLAVSGVWHSMAAYYFCVHSRWILRSFVAAPRFGRVRDPRGRAVEAQMVLLLQWLGALNISVVLVALLTLYRRLRIRNYIGTSDALLVLGAVRADG